jgi:eukaryotic-like serine/threonine-protein kinase
VLGEGGMATVFEAWDPVLHRTLAVKLVDQSTLDPEAKPEVLRRFKREAQAAARLAHANVVQVYEYGEEADYCFIAMEHVSGKPLTAYLGEGLKSELHRVRDIIGQLLEALAYSHTQGVVHRDIKPGNLLVTREGTIKVTDFGIARIEASSVTQHGHMLGTPSYMSPEQYLGDTPDGRADLFATGVLLYELLTGVKPFAGESNGQIMNKILYETPIDPSRLNPLLPPGVDWVVQKALAKAPEDRFNNAREYREALFNAIPDDLGETAGTRADALADPNRGAGVLNAARKLRTLARTNESSVSPADSTVSGLAALGEFNTTQSSRPRVLFIDDEERILTALKTIFRGRYHVLTAANGQEALDFIGKFKIPVIVSDQRMPGMQGVELLRRARELSPDSVRILLTGYSDLASIVGSINEGEVYRFISKPWDNQDLQLIMSEAVEIGQHMIDRKSAAAQQAKMSAGIMVLDQRPGVFDALRRLLGHTHELVYAPTIDQALFQMEQREIGVLVADIDNEVDNYLILFNQLKQKYPQILVIVLTSASDSEMVIHLINEAQIYRFLNKPVNLGLMQQHLSGAIGRYAEYQSSPELLERHKVKGSEKAQASAFGRGLVERLKSLRNVFAMQAK